MAVLIGYTSYNRLEFTRRTLPALLEWAARVDADVRIVVVDDCSDDGSAEWLTWRYEGGQDRHFSYWYELILRKGRSGNAVCSNLAWRMTEGDYVKWDNDVVLLRDDWLDVLQAVADRIPGIVAHNCEGGRYYPPGGFSERLVGGATIAQPNRNEYNTVAGACVLITAETRAMCGRWNEREAYQALNRGLDLTYSAKVRFAGLLSVYTTGRRDVYVKGLHDTLEEPPGYPEERARMKGRVRKWTSPVIEAYRSGRRELDDVK